MIELDKEHYIKNAKNIDSVAYDFKNNKLQIFIVDLESEHQFKTVTFEYDKLPIMQNRSASKGFEDYQTISEEDIKSTLEALGVNYDQTFNNIKLLLGNVNSDLFLDK